MHRSTWQLAALALASVIGGARLTAQQVHGVVRDSASTSPVAGVVVLVRDPAGHVSARTLTDERGRFSVATLGQSTTLHILRIGFQPRDIPLPAPGDARAGALEVRIVSLPAMLSVIESSEQPLCPGSAERGAAYRLWEQARAALLATIVARETKPFTATLLVFQRTVAPDRDRVLAQTMRTRSGTFTRPFVASAPPATFAIQGYISEDATGRTYNAPDADVLLDESFAATHCFHVASSDAAHPGQVGLAFEPVPGRDTIVDVGGVLWLDRTVPALRTLEFHYTKLEEPAMAAHAGGSTTFRTMPNGIVFIERWVLRTPVLGRKLKATRGLPTTGMASTEDHEELRVVNIRETGGETIEAAWPDGAHWNTPLATITGRVVQPKTHQPVEHIVVTLQGTSDTTITDGRGRFVLSQVFPGRYTIQGADTSLAPFIREQAVARDVEAIRDQSTDITLELPSPTESVARLCRDERTSDNTSLLIGTVTDSNGTAFKNIELRVAWQASYAVGTSTNAIATREATRMINPDSVGHFYVCGVIRDRDVRLALWRGAAKMADTIAIMPADSLIHRFDWQVSPRSGAPVRKP